MRRLTTDDDAIHRFGAFSKDGARIVYASNGRNGVDFDTYVMEIASGEARLVQEAAGNRAILAWSPDERYLLTEEAVGSLQIELYLVDLTGGEAPRHLTAGRGSRRLSGRQMAEPTASTCSPTAPMTGARCCGWTRPRGR